MQPRKVGGAWSNFGRKQRPEIQKRLQPKRKEMEKQFMQRWEMFPKLRRKLRLDIDHDHGERVVHCSCGYQKYKKRGWTGEPKI